MTADPTPDDDFDDDPWEMPTPCQPCGRIVELDDMVPARDRAADLGLTANDLICRRCSDDR